MHFSLVETHRFPLDITTSRESLSVSQSQVFQRMTLEIELIQNCKVKWQKSGVILERSA
jgi:hypothetical protein